MANGKKRYFGFVLGVHPNTCPPPTQPPTPPFLFPVFFCPRQVKIFFFWFGSWPRLLEAATLSEETLWVLSCNETCTQQADNTTISFSSPSLSLKSLIYGIKIKAKVHTTFYPQLGATVRANLPLPSSSSLGFSHSPLSRPPPFSSPPSPFRSHTPTQSGA